MIKDKNLKKNFIWNTIGSVIFSFTSLIFMIIVTRINGISSAGIFSYSFALACVFQVISNYFGRTFQVTNLEESYKESDFFYHRISTCALATILIGIFLIIKGYSFYKNIVIMLLFAYRIIESFSEVMYGTIQKKGELYKVGYSLLLKSVIGTSVFFLTDLVSKNLILSIVLLDLTVLIITLMYDRKNYIKNIKLYKIDKKIIYLLLKTGFSVFIFLFLTQFLLNIPKYIIDETLNNESQTIYGILSMPSTFIILCSQLIVQPFLKSLTDKIKNKNYKSFKIDIYKIIILTIIIGIFFEFVCYFVGIPILELIYGLNLKEHLMSLLIIIAGAICWGIIYVNSTALVALRYNKIQVLIFAIGSVIITSICSITIPKLEVLGASISYFVSMLILTILFILTLILVIKKKNKES